MSSMEKWGPRYKEIRDPRDNKKKFGMFWNWPRYLYFGGQAQGIKLNQQGDKMPGITQQGKGQNAVGPINDRGK